MTSVSKFYGPSKLKITLKLIKTIWGTQKVNLDTDPCIKCI